MAREVCIGMMGRTCAVSDPGYVVYNIYDIIHEWARCVGETLPRNLKSFLGVAEERIL